jgi:hypothetical protein
MIIDCDACAVRGPACGDCVVSVLLGTPSTTKGAEQAAIAVLAGSGLVPPLRLLPLAADQAVGRTADPPVDPTVHRPHRATG